MRADSSPRKPATRARLAVVVAGLLFSTGGAAIKLTAFNPWQVAGFRALLAAAALLVLFPAARRRFDRRVFVVGVAYAACFLTFVHANKLTTAASAVFLVSAAPLYLLFLGPLVLGERVRRSDPVYLAVLALGLSCFYFATDRPSASAPDPFLGNVVAGAGGLAWALSLLGLRWMERYEGRSPGVMVAAVVYGNLITFAVSLPFSLAGIGQATTEDWLVIGYLGLFQVGLAYVFLVPGVRGVSALEASLLLLLEPACSPLWAWWLHDERPGALTLVGGAIILATLLVRIATDSVRPGTPRRGAQ